MNDVTHEAELKVGDVVFRAVSEHGVCDMSRSQGDDEGNLRCFTYDQLSAEQALDLAGELVKCALAAKNFHGALVDNLRAQVTNGATPHDADGDA